MAETQAAESHLSQATAPPPSQMPAKRWSVIDTTCVNTPPPNALPGSPAPPRVHDLVINGQVRSYIFNYGKPLEMTEAEARKFMAIEAFQVFNTQGDRVLPTVSVFEGIGTNRRELANNECIARFDELTLDSLRDRAAPLPGGENIIRANTPKAEVIAFMIGARKKKQALERAPEKAPARSFDPDDVDDMDEMEARRMAEFEDA